MTVGFDDDDLRAAFADYRHTQGPKVRSAGAVAARRRALSRRRRRYGFLSAAAIVGLLAPAAAIALAGGDGAPIGGDLPTPIRTDGSIPKGGLAKAQLLVSSVRMPVFEGDTTGTCPQGEVGLADDRLQLYQFPDTGQYMSYVDIDRDGRAETVLHVRCLNGERVVAEQILVVAPGSGASVELKGRVLGTGGDISGVVSVGTSADGTISVLAAGPRTCCAEFYTGVEHQRRVYSWNGQGFRQKAGSTSFGQRPPVELVVTAPAVQFESKTGILRLTITNAGTQPVDGVMLTLVSRGLRTVDEVWQTRTSDVDPVTIKNMRAIDGLEPGDTFTTEVTMRLGISDVQLCTLSVTAVGIIGEGDVTDDAADTKPDNNEDVAMTLRFD